MHENRNAWRQEHDRVSGVLKATRVVWWHQWSTSVLSGSNHQIPGKAGNAVAQAVEDNHGGSQLTVDHTEMITITIFQSRAFCFGYICLWVATGLKYVETMAISRRISTLKCQPSKRMTKKNCLGRSSVLGPPGSARFFIVAGTTSERVIACHGFGKRLPVTVTC